MECDRCVLSVERLVVILNDIYFSPTGAKLTSCKSASRMSVWGSRIRALLFKLPSIVYFS